MNPKKGAAHAHTSVNRLVVTSADTIQHGRTREDHASQGQPLALAYLWCPRPDCSRLVGGSGLQLPPWLDYLPRYVVDDKSTRHTNALSVRKFARWGFVVHRHISCDADHLTGSDSPLLSASPHLPWLPASVRATLVLHAGQTLQSIMHSLGTAPVLASRHAAIARPQHLALARTLPAHRVVAIPLATCCLRQLAHRCCAAFAVLCGSSFSATRDTVLMMLLLGVVNEACHSFIMRRRAPDASFIQCKVCAAFPLGGSMVICICINRPPR